MRMLRTNQSKITRSQPYYAALVNESHNAFFSSRSEKSIFFDVDIVVENKSKYRGLYSYRQRVYVITLSPNIFSYCFCMLSGEFAKVFERKVYRVQVAHLHNAACALSSPSCCFQDKYLFHCLWYCGKKTNVVKRGLYSCRRYPSLRGQNVLQQIELHHKARALL